MRSISIKALITANIAEVILLFGGIFIIVQIGIVAELAALGPGHLHDAIEAAGDSSAVAYATFLYYVAVCCVGGAIAAWMAGERKLLHGALSSTLVLLSYLYPSSEDRHFAAIPDWLDFGVSYSAPLFGMIGALLAARANWRTAVRWSVAFAAMIVIYVLGWLLAGRLGWSFGRALAAALGIIAGMSIAPGEQRKQAFMQLSGCLIAVPIAVLLWRLAAGGGSVGNIMWILYDVIGVLFAYMFIRRVPGWSM